MDTERKTGLETFGEKSEEKINEEKAKCSHLWLVGGEVKCMSL